MANNANHAVYALNTVANFDEAIIPYLGAPIGTYFARLADGSFQIEK
jgi:hypothetical protein